MGDEDEVRTTEQERLRALRERDIERAERLHADDFELITPDGVRLTKDAYLADVRAGVIRYITWEPDDIRVRLFEGGAAIRYTSTIEVVDADEHFGPNRYWHTDVYERRNGRWQVVWSQATQDETEVPSTAT
jgi:hypothetical protein